MADPVEEEQEIDPEYVESHLQVTMGLIWDQVTVALGNQAGLLSSGPKIGLQPRPPRFVSHFYHSLAWSECVFLSSDWASARLRLRHLGAL